MLLQLLQPQLRLPAMRRLGSHAMLYCISYQGGQAMLCYADFEGCVSRHCTPQDLQMKDGDVIEVVDVQVGC